MASPKWWMGQHQPSDKPRHLSLTGAYAGLRLCGVAPNEGEAWHAAYLSGSNWRSENICLDCIQVWAIAEDEDEHGREVPRG